jgi:hypothetical protein
METAVTAGFERGLEGRAFELDEVMGRSLG